MKTLLDRCNPLFLSDHAFREVYLLTAATDERKSAMDGAVKGIQGWIDCFEKARLASALCGTGISNSGEAKNHSDLLTEVYNLGKNA